jgi:hypothetical protein
MDPPPARPSRSFPMGVVLLAIVGALVVAIALPGILAAQRHGGERTWMAYLRTLATAEVDFRSNDRDGDRAHNFWIYDVYSLYAMEPSADGTSPGAGWDPARAIKLIEPSLAAADASGRPLLPGVVAPAAAIGEFTPKGGYVYLALATDRLDGRGGARLRAGLCRGHGVPVLLRRRESRGGAVRGRDAVSVGPGLRRVAPTGLIRRFSRTPLRPPSLTSREPGAGLGLPRARGVRIRPHPRRPQRRGQSGA